jgi:hypothetical protein
MADAGNLVLPAKTDARFRKADSPHWARRIVRIARQQQILLRLPDRGPDRASEGGVEANQKVVLAAEVAGMELPSLRIRR